MAEFKFLFCALALFAGATAFKVQPKLRATLEAKNKAGILINFVGGNGEAILATKSQALSNRAAKITFLKEQLEKHTSFSQRNVQNFLNEKGVSFESFWISNQIYIKGATRDLVESLAKFAEIKKIMHEPKITFGPVARKPTRETKFVRKNDELVWSLKTINVERAWQYTNGSGVLVGHIDTGVWATHESVRDSFIGIDYGWYDPTLFFPEPYDPIGHGTHTMGTILGTHGIGVAPGAKWMACQACSSPWTCTIPGFVKCAQWVLCPTNINGTEPDCSKAPQLVSNSWGGSEEDGDDFFDEVGASWHAAGIIPIFAVGNEGRGEACSSTRHPGGEDYVIGVGATTIDDEIAEFSSLGPGLKGHLKPDLTAPGKDVISASGKENEYESKSGTSMSAPHLSGVVSLMLSINPNLTFTEVREILTSSGVDSESLVSHNTTCGGTGDNQFPNNIFGYGRLNAGKAVLATIESMHK